MTFKGTTLLELRKSLVLALRAEHLYTLPYMVGLARICKDPGTDGSSMVVLREAMNLCVKAFFWIRVVGTGYTIYCVN